VDVEALPRREATGVHQAKHQKEIKGVGVTPEAQHIFNTIYKTLPCRWHGKSIIVFDEVRIDPPYTVESCVADSSSSSALELVRKIVAGTREKMALNLLKGG
jgi:hypothetical protein